jgi:hypothetical protein
MSISICMDPLRDWIAVSLAERSTIYWSWWSYRAGAEHRSARSHTTKSVVSG